MGEQPYLSRLGTNGSAGGDNTEGMAKRRMKFIEYANWTQRLYLQIGMKNCCWWYPNLFTVKSIAKKDKVSIEIDSVNINWSNLSSTIFNIDHPVDSLWAELMVRGFLKGLDVG